MGYIAAALNKKGQDASQTIINMLKNSGLRTPSLSYGIADSKGIEYGREVQDFTQHTNDILLAAIDVFPENYPPNPIQQGDHSLVFNGTLLDTDLPDSLSAANCLENNPIDGIKELIRYRTGFYSITAITKTAIMAGIDHVGTIPLYFGENNENKAIASNKKMLWAIGIKSQPIKPGHIIKLSKRETKIERVRTIENPKIQQSVTIESLNKIMEETCQAYSKKFPKLTIAFSGGIDSTLLTYYLNQTCSRIELIWTGVENQPEKEIAQKAADYLDLNIQHEEFKQKDVEQILESILLSIEEPDPVKTGIAYPFFWSSKKTYRMGYTSMCSGNGADELFGGYQKYVIKFIEEGDPSGYLYLDILNSYINNFHRDTKTCIDNGIRLLLPYTHPKLVDYALKIPISQKIQRNLNKPRKKILRKLAISQNIPKELAVRPKKAAQYSSGVNKTLQKIAKKHGMNLKELIKIRYKRVLTECNFTFC
jgi:asparagine synthase (glutamine-hydrolysing)